MDNDDLVPIGRFAQASRLSLKALRIYDRLGLLRPAYIDPTRLTATTAANSSSAPG